MMVIDEMKIGYFILCFVLHQFFNNKNGLYHVAQILFLKCVIHKPVMVIIRVISYVK